MKKRVVKIVMDDFKERYIALKNKGYTDFQISQQFYICMSTLKRLKKEHLSDEYRGRKTMLPISEEQLQQGESIGLTRRLMYQRMRLHGWEAWEACSVENMGRGKGKKRK